MIKEKPASLSKTSFVTRLEQSYLEQIALINGKYRNPGLNFIKQIADEKQFREPICEQGTKLLPTHKRWTDIALKFMNSCN